MTDTVTLLRGARESAGLSRAQLADRIGVSMRQIARYEAGHSSIPFDIAISFADAVGASVVDFVPLSGADDEDDAVGSSDAARLQDAPGGGSGARSLNRTEASDAHA